MAYRQRRSIARGRCVVRRASCVTVFLAAVCLFVGSASAAAATAGSYSGLNPQNNQKLFFYVSANGKEVQDVSIPFVSRPCTTVGGADPADHLTIVSIPIQSGESFTATKTQKGVIKSFVATFKYTFSGQFART